jgi:hypothetical protein
MLPEGGATISNLDRRCSIVIERGPSAGVMLALRRSAMVSLSHLVTAMTILFTAIHGFRRPRDHAKRAWDEMREEPCTGSA